MKILLLVHKKLIPPAGAQPKTKKNKAKWRTEYDVREALKYLGHKIEVIGLDFRLEPLIKMIDQWRPDLVFNLLEEFSGEAIFDQNIVSLLELKGIPYTGCNPRGLSAARDKALAKKIVAYHQIATPKFFVISRQQRTLRIPRGLKFPFIVKYLNEEASLGIGRENVVTHLEGLNSQIQRMLNEFEADLLIEEYIAGREIYVGALGNEIVEILPPRELHFGKMPRSQPKIATRQIKWSPSFRKRNGVFTRAMNTQDPALLKNLRKSSMTIYHALRLTGYCRLDFRVDNKGVIHFIEANPNPQICRGEDFADSALNGGWTYEELIQRIVELAHQPVMLGSVLN